MNKSKRIVFIRAELSGARRGCLKVTIDFDQHFIRWQDNQQWNNDFLKSFSKMKMIALKKEFVQLDILKIEATQEVERDFDACTTQQELLWIIQVGFSNQEICSWTGEDVYAPEWISFRKFIEQHLKVAFRLR